MRASLVRIDPDPGMNIPSNVSMASSASLARLVARLAALRHLWLALLLAAPAMLTLLAPGYFMKAHDARHSIFFLIEFDRSFSEGVLWPVWGPDHAVGFGYPTFLLYAPLAFFVGEAFHLLGLGFAAAIKATWALGFLLGAAGAYQLARRWFSPALAMITSLAFTYAPYHLSQIYVRAALAEFMALAWLPWVVLAFLSLWDSPGPRRAAFAALSLCALMLLHTVSILTYVPLLVGLLMVLFLRDLMRERGSERTLLIRLRESPAGWTISALLLAGLLAGIFFVPMLVERGDVAEWQWVKDTYNYRLHFVYPGQFLDPSWGYGYSVEGPGDGMSFQLGIVTFLLASLGTIAGLSRWDGKPMPRVLVAFFVAATAVTLVMMTSVAGLVWDYVPLVELLQFPWRLLAITTFTLAFLAALGVAWLNSHDHTPTDASGGPYLYVIGLALVLTSIPFTRPELVSLRPTDESPLAVLDFELNYPDMRGSTRFAQRPPENADSPLITQYLEGQPLQKAAIAAGSGEILEQESGGLFARARVRSAAPITLRFYTHFFPGWRATMDGQPVPIRPDGPNGLIALDVPPGEHEVIVRFGSTPPRVAGVILSGVGLVVILLLIAVERKRSEHVDGHVNLR